MRTVVQAGAVALAGACGVAAALFFFTPAKEAGATGNDRSGEFIISTGAVSVNPKIQTDGVWLLDYKSGKLLGTVIDRLQGKIVGWAEVDLATEFGLQARADVHFMMTSGYITQGQSALYLAETSTGQFGVYTMGPGANGTGVAIRRHDMTKFRQQQQPPQGGPGQPGQPGPGAGLPRIP